MSKKQNPSTAVTRLEDALERLLKGEPERVKLRGDITLNTVNREAGLGASYVYSFTEFCQFARPLIDGYNNKRLKAPTAKDTSTEENDKEDVAVKSELEKLRDDVKRLRAERDSEARLKVKYKRQRDDNQLIADTYQNKINDLMYELHDLRAEISEANVIEISGIR